MTTPTILFGDTDCSVHWGHYGGGRTALILRNAVGDVVLVASQNLPHSGLTPNELALKPRSGLLSALVDAAIVQPTGQHIDCDGVALDLVHIVDRELQ